MAKWNLHSHDTPARALIYKGFASVPWNVEAFFQKTLFKKLLSLSQLMLKVPVNKGSRVFPAGAKGRRRFTSLSQTRCETFVKRQKQGKGLKGPVNRGL
jgi:hypothetical protein